MTDSNVAMDTSELTWDLDDATAIRPLEAGDTVAMYQLIQSNREHLDRWLRWSNAIRSEADAAGAIALAVARQSAGTGFHSGIWVDGTLAGAVVCRDVDPANRNAEIGYWLAADRMGRGLATRAAARATDYLIRVRGMHRVEMQCAVDNLRSRAIPERLGYTFEGIRREAVLLVTTYIDHAVYAVLDGEWCARGTADTIAAVRPCR